MTWRQPAAWFGLFALAIPILVHLLGRRRPKPLRFPTLRFLDVSRIVPARRHRVNDVPLLLVRLAIVAAAVAALAGPVFGTRATNPDALARVIVVDTSASMSRRTPGGTTAGDDAQARAQSLAASASASRIVSASTIAPAIMAAVNWLNDQPGRREIVVISDFQAGAIDRSDVASVPADLGVTFVRIETVAAGEVPGPAIAIGGQTFLSRLSLERTATRTIWIAAPAGTPVTSPLSTLAGPDDRQALGAALEVAAAEGVPGTTTDRQVVVVFPSASERSAITGAARPPADAWMFDTLRTLYEDPLLASFGCGEQRCLDRLAVSATADAGPSRLVLLPATEPGHVFSAALLRSAWRAAARPASVTELEPQHLDDAVLERWNRAAAPAPAAGASGDESNARWLWAVVLLLLAIETWMRRSPRPAVVEVEHARVA